MQSLYYVYSTTIYIFKNNWEEVMILMFKYSDVQIFISIFSYSVGY